MGKLRNCDYCLKEYEAINGRSRYCGSDHRKCLKCEKLYQINPTRYKNYCSKLCSITHETHHKTCPLCNKDFKGSIAQKYCKNPHMTNCEVCRNEIANLNYKKLSRYCSAKCKANAIDYELKCETCERSFTSKTKQARYCGSAHLDYRNCQHCKKLYVTRLELKSTTCSKHCAAHLIDYEDRNSKMRATLKERYGVNNSYQLPEIVEKSNLANGYKISKTNKAWQKELFERFEVNFLFETSFGKSRYADLNFENLFIDINPSVSHSSSHIFTHMIGRCHKTPCNCAPKVTTYHQDRALEVTKSDKRLLQYFDWYNKDAFIGIIARELSVVENLTSDEVEIKEISLNTAQVFFKSNHVEKVKLGNRALILGLFHDGELITAQQYERELDIHGEWLITASCNRTNCSFKNSLSLLEEHFLLNYEVVKLDKSINLAFEILEKDNSLSWILKELIPPRSQIVLKGKEKLEVFDAGQAIYELVS